jgi:hypothetical protein
MQLVSLFYYGRSISEHEWLRVSSVHQIHHRLMSGMNVFGAFDSGKETRVFFMGDWRIII